MNSEAREPLLGGGDGMPTAAGGPQRHLNRRYVSSTSHCKLAYPSGQAMRLWKDIKRDNLLLDRYRHLRLSEFGLCKPFECSTLEEKDFATRDHVSNSTGQGHSAAPKRTKEEQLQHWQKNRRTIAYSTVGTPDYIAPEFPPEAQLYFEAKDLISKLLYNINHRLGSKGADGIKFEHQIKSSSRSGPWRRVNFLWSMTEFSVSIREMQEKCQMIEFQQRKCSIIFDLSSKLARVLEFCTCEIPQAFLSGADTNFCRLVELIVFVLNHLASVAHPEFFDL
ncbi:hypothetical protein L1887_27073 [Cichorium endivia]|nr:hypothetical protein L1887_27073 [Cichorium endivia]